jgi:hypothetical protein
MHKQRVVVVCAVLAAISSARAQHNNIFEWGEAQGGYSID